MADKQQYFSILTDIGRYKIARAAADKGSVQFTHLAVGDGGGQETNPVPSQTQLVREVWRTQIEAADIDPHNPAAVIVAAIIPRTEGGWWMREFGLFDADGDMLAVVKPAPNYKATMAEGQNEDIVYQFQLLVGQNANVVAVIDPSSQYLTKEAADKFYPSREEMAQAISAGITAVTGDFVKKDALDTALGGVKVLNHPWLAVRAIDLAAPPEKPELGAVYLIASGGSGAWKGKDGQLAEWRGDNGQWRFVRPLNGHGLGLPDGKIYVRQNGTYKLLDLTLYGVLAAVNNWLAENIFQNGIAVSAEAGKDPQWPFVRIRLPYGDKRGGGIDFEPQDKKSPRIEIGYHGDGGIHIWREGFGDFIIFMPDGNIMSQRAKELFDSDKLMLDAIKDYIGNNGIRDIHCAGEWHFDGKKSGTGYGGPWLIMEAWNSGGDGVFGFKRTELWFQMANGQWRRCNKV